MNQNAEPIDMVGIRTLEEEKRYWRDQAFQARSQFYDVAERLTETQNRLATSERDLRDAEQRITLLDGFQRVANQTGYRTPYILPACNVETIEEEIGKASTYEGPRATDYPTVIGKIVYDRIAKGGSGRWLFEPAEGAQIYNGDTVIGQVIGENGKQVTPNKHRHDQRRNKQRK